MSESSEEIVQRQLEAYNAHDIEAFVAMYSSNAAYIEHPAGKVLFMGHAELRKRYGDLFLQHPKVHVEIKNRITQGQFVVDHEQVTGREGVAVGHVIVVYEVQDNLIQRAWVIRG